MVREATQRLQTARFLREIALVAVAYLAYYLVRSAAAGKVLDAFANAQLIVRAEQAMGIFVELPLQVAVLSYGGLTDFFSLYYFWGHFPLIVAFAIWAFYRHHDEYRWTRNAIFLSGGVALIVYLTFPVAPPRLLPGAGFVDTLRGVFALQYDSSDLVNQYAAVPSMHQGFALIVGVALYRIVPGWNGAVLLFLLSALMFVSIVVTANHYFLDALFGLAAAVLGMILATRWERLEPRVARWVQQRWRGLRRTVWGPA